MKEEVKGAAATKACVSEPGSWAQLPILTLAVMCVEPWAAFLEPQPMCSRAMFSGWSHFLYLSPATHELWQSQAWPSCTPPSSLWISAPVPQPY